MFMTLLTSWAFLIWMIALFVVVVRRRFVCGAIVNDVVHWIAQVVSCPAGRTVLCSVCDGFWRRSAHVWVRGAWFVNTFHSVYLFVCVYICTSVSPSFYIFCSFYLYVCPVLCPSGVLICSYIFIWSRKFCGKTIYSSYADARTIVVFTDFSYAFICKCKRHKVRE